MSGTELNIENAAAKSESEIILEIPHFVSREDRRLRQSVAVWVARIAATVFWLYVTLHVFVFNVDEALVELQLPLVPAIIQYKFFVLLGLILIIATLVPWRVISFYLVYLAFFPLIRIVAFVIRLFIGKRWLAILALANFTISSFASFKHLLQIFVYSIFAWGLVVLTTLPYANLIGALLAILVFGSQLLHSFRTGKRPDLIVEGYLKLFPIEEIRQSNDRFCIPPNLGNKPIAEFSDSEITEYNQRLDRVVIMGTVSGFLAKRLHDYEQSSYRLLPTLISFLSLVVGNILFFGIANKGLFGFNPEQFLIGEQARLFDFVFFSFSNVIFSSLSEISAVGDYSRGLVMAQSLSVLLMICVLFSSYFSVRNDQYKESLSEIRESLSAISEEVEAHAKKEFGYNNLKDAAQHLRAASAALSKTLFNIIKEDTD